MPGSPELDWHVEYTSIVIVVIIVVDVMEETCKSGGGRLPFHETANEYFLLFLFALLQPQQHQLKSSLLSLRCLCKVLHLPALIVFADCIYLLLNESE